MSATLHCDHIEQFVGKESFIDRADAMAKALQGAPKAKGSDRIYTPGEMEWNKYQKAQDGLELPLNVVDFLEKLGSELGLEIN